MCAAISFLKFLRKEARSQDFMGGGARSQWLSRLAKFRGKGKLQSCYFYVTVEVFIYTK